MPKYKRLDWFKFFPADFLDGTEEMTNAEVGAYIRLLAKSWLKSGTGGACGVPAKENLVLSFLPNTNKKGWKRIKKAVLSKFTLDTITVKGQPLQILVNERLRQELEEVRAVSEIQKTNVSKRKDRSTVVEPPYTIGSTKPLPIEREKEKEAEVDKEPPPPGNKEIEENPMARKRSKQLDNLLNELIIVWQDKKGTKGAIPPLPDFPEIIERWEQLAASADWDILKQAFGVWAAEVGMLERPFNDFKRCAVDYMVQVAPSKQEQQFANEESARAARREESSRLASIEAQKEAAETLRKKAERQAQEDSGPTVDDVLAD